MSGGGSGVSGGLLSNPGQFLNNWTGGVGDTWSAMGNAASAVEDEVGSAVKNFLPSTDTLIIVGVLVVVVIIAANSRR